MGANLVWHVAERTQIKDIWEQDVKDILIYNFFNDAL
jgi:hypothetical protein